ncbi:hypothetical protein AB1Y20_015034 [Prymnesium parvum]|uniref:peptidylprolyl isomerase n=1 Tax=Prymnesium parvum TaxID=97485 RepID=A0AB34JVK2_PRYPA
MKTLGPLLPRDFLERQPARWKRSQQRRGATKVLRRMLAKREKLEEKTMRHAYSDAGVSTDRTPKRHDAAEASAPPPPVHAHAASSTSTGFGPLTRGFWAAELLPNRPLVITIPEGAQLYLLHAALSSDPAASETSQVTAVRCRTPATKIPTTLCYLQHAPPPKGGSAALPSCHSDSSQLQLMFTQAKDGRCALASEGPHSVHLVGMYTRAQALQCDDSKEVAARSVNGGGGQTSHVGNKNKEADPADGKQEAASSTSTTKSEPRGHAAVKAALQEVANGLKVVDTEVGRGRATKLGDRLSVRYTGLTTDSKGNWFQFDDNRGKAFHFKLGEGTVIRGWDQGLVGMRRGGTRRLIVPAALGYGSGGSGPILPNATLVFEVHLDNVQ